MKKRELARRSAKRNLKRLFTGVILILIVCISFGVLLVSAHEKSDNKAVYTYYKSIEIQPVIHFGILQNKQCRIIRILLQNMYSISRT